MDVENALKGFAGIFSLEDVPDRTRKHIASPDRKSNCKRLNMFLRWMGERIRVDFGIWKNIRPAQLICPVDIHVASGETVQTCYSGNKTDWLVQPLS